MSSSPSHQRDHEPRTRILAIHRYYWPDSPPYASMLRAIAARWARDGAEVRVLGTQPTYKPEANIPWRPWREQLDGVSVRRIRLIPETGSRLRRLLNVPLFIGRAMGHTLTARRGEVVMCSTSPPVLLAAAVSVAARLKRARFIYHCMDVHPEIGALSGEFRNPLVYRLLRRVDRATCRRSSAVVVLSGDMRDALLARDATLEDRIEVLNNFALPDYSDRHAQVPTEAVVSSRPALRLVFTGNVGRFQGLEDLVNAVLESDADVDFTIMGEGTAKDGLRRLVATHAPERRSRVNFLPYGTPAEARAVMRAADVGVVSLTAGIVRYAYPSKTMTYLSEGLPLLLLAETESEIAGTIHDERVGVVVEPGDRAGIDDALQNLARLATDEWAGMRTRTAALADRSFNVQKVLDRWADLLDRVGDRSTASI